MTDFAIKIENLRKQYKLGAIGGGTLRSELQSWWARKRGKEDPNMQIGQDCSNFGETFWALDGINLEIKKGEALGIIGANGAGKSTLLKILSRVTAPTEGDIWINGRIASMLEVGTGFHGEMTGRENIYMNGAILGMSKKEVDEKIESIIDFSECRQFIDTPVKRYSSGMYVKLAFAVASHLDAEIMVMDEVLAVGDMKFQKKCLGKMGNAAQNEGKTVLYVSHNMATIRNLCSRCIVLDKGKMIFDGEVEKAISIYLNYGETSLQKSFKMVDSERVVYGFGKDFHINSIEFDRDVPIYSDTDNIRLHLSYDSKSKYKDVQTFMHIFNASTGAPLSLVTSDYLDTSLGKQILEFNPQNIAEGFYYFEIGAIRMLPDGSHITLDRTKDKVYFQIIRENHGDLPKWSNSIYGSAILPKMKVLNDEYN
ncbi:ABC transporter ATP-binding protein [bacterium]|nr:ABC transporter ATP-binding protein [bacterium]